MDLFLIFIGCYFFSYLCIYNRLNNTIKYQSIENRAIQVPAVLEKNSLLLQKETEIYFKNIKN